MGSSDCLACDSGKFSSQVGALTSSVCKVCDSGKFSNKSGASTCQLCPNNSWSREGSANTDCLCNPGYYRQNGISCAPCPPGSWNQFNGSSVCGLCAGGTYSKRVGSSSVLTCLACPNFTTSFPGSSALSNCIPSAGYVFLAYSVSLRLGIQNVSDSVNGTDIVKTVTDIIVVLSVADPLRITVLKQGQSRRLANLILNVRIDSFHNFEAADTVATSINQTALSSAYFQIGQNQFEVVLLEVPSIDIHVAPCGLGMHKPINGVSECLNCSAGQYSAVYGASVCIPCSSGKFSSLEGASNQSVCKFCKAGTFTGTSAASCCTNCTAYSWSPEGSSSQSNCSCNSGYSGENGGCLPCQVGKFKSNHGEGNCSECSAGKYSQAEASTVCDPCEQGMYKPNNGTAQCLPCSPGFFSQIQGASVCIGCTAGKYSTLTGAPNNLSCVACGSGTFSTGTGFTTCIQCPNFTSNEDNLDDRNSCSCNRGYSAQSNSTCALCNAGTYKSISGSFKCLGCPTGKFSDLQGSTVCRNCAAGKYSSVNESSKCHICTPGTYAFESGSAHCDACRAGTFSSALGGSTGDVCQNCPANTSSDARSTHLSNCTCIPGFYRGESGGNCVGCEHGKYSAMNGSLTCSSCSEGTFADISAASSCKKCSQNSWSPAGSISSLNCSCNSGFGVIDRDYAGGNCTVCEAGKFKSAIGSWPCLVCPAGTYSDGATPDNCKQCPPGSSSTPGSKSRFNCTCSAGFYGEDGGICKPCAEGTFKSNVGAGSCTNCTGKPESALYIQTASVSPNCSWVCHPGYISDGYQCLRCLINLPLHTQFYRNGECAYGCIAGYYNLSATSCERCPIGKFSFVNSFSCINCSNAPSYIARYVRNDSASEDCSWTCNEGYYQILPGQNSPRPTAPETETCSVLMSLNDTFVQESGVLCYPGLCASVEGCFYSNDATVSAIIAPGNGASMVSFTFTKFDLETARDFLYIESCTDSSCSNSSVLSKLSSPDSVSNWIPPVQSSLSGIMRLRFVSDEQIGWTGFSGYWQSVFNRSFCVMCSNGPQQSVYTADGGVENNCSWVCNAGFFSNGHQCVACNPGEYKSTSGSMSCKLCDAGTFSGITAATTCDICTNNSFSKSGSLLCECNAGFVLANHSNCSPCPIGTYKGLGGSGMCIPCNPGAYSDTNGSVFCVGCPKNSFSAQGSFDLNNCNCNQGFSRGLEVANKTTGFFQGKTVEYCMACEPGTFTALNGSSSCLDCIEGTYSNQSASSFCFVCPAKSISLNRSANISDCTCQAGFSGISALSCASGSCKAGFYKSSSGSAQCLACPNSSFSNASGSTFCTDCPVGAFSDSGASACSSCTNLIPGARFFTSGNWSGGCQWKCEIGNYFYESMCNQCSLISDAYFVPDDVHEW
eukprot:CAMPEP_0172199746 /NCGR_PEP_ID=MMETSP1050-20130122/28874_1 /TAXON_ID=233186 /ORGANISM="Cryptomonas curvata, Strain CCAP979/52" /LENGTH=1396 /DNA_ID=CAMNT_0012876833 /DNA_START=2565 /DNA_END=6752 /DNA_ORIENTATION=+